MILLSCVSTCVVAISKVALCVFIGCLEYKKYKLYCDNISK
ncbi:MAG: hypothetical protein E7K49_18750 [Clostridioides difficile]|nr:hypothetical protein [Clostridioides difficile]